MVATQVGGHERAKRHDREPPLAGVVERAGREVGAEALPLEGRVDLGVDEGAARAIGPVDELPGHLAVDAQLVARVRGIVDDRDLGLRHEGGHARQ